MAKEIWLGPLLGNNRERLIERCSDLVSQNKTHTFLYLAASHPLLELVTQGILDGVRNRGVWGELPVYLFRGFVRRLLSSAIDDSVQPLTPRVPIDQEELPLKRSLVSQILWQLKATNQLPAIGPLANREGCVTTVATLIGEIQRAAKSPAEVAEIVASRALAETLSVSPAVAGGSISSDEQGSTIPSRQIDFDKEIALIYATYCELLDRHLLTEADADQRRTLSVLNGTVNGLDVHVPWLADVDLLVLDGFFDFTPVQGEILRHLIPAIPDVLINLNHDASNREIFLPFEQTIEQLSSMAAFELKTSDDDTVPVQGSLAGLRESLFNSAPVPVSARAEVSGERSSSPVSQPQPLPAGGEGLEPQSEIRYLECGDRDTEIRAIAKEVKSLILTEGFALADIALVVRQRASYAETIARVMREESLPCDLEARIEATDIPANRAALKLMLLLEELAREESSKLRTSDLADLIKSEYFRLGEADLEKLLARFDATYAHLLSENSSDDKKKLEPKHRQYLQRLYRIGLWDADALENAFAYVGSELPVSDWLKRAQKLIKELPTAMATRELLNIGVTEQARDPDEADQVESAETAKVESSEAEKKRRPSRDIHPAALAWTTLVLETFADHVHAVPREGTPNDLRAGLIRLFETLCFREQIARPIRRSLADEELPQAMLNFNSLEVLRRAFAAAIKSIVLPRPPDAENASSVKLDTFIGEVRRCLVSQSQTIGRADRAGLRVLEATDVRGLRFRAVFIAGLVEGGFPMRASRDWIYPHEERERLKQHGLTLEDISPATLLKEEHYFYQSACRATERLYLTRPLLLEDDSETVASYYIDELRRAVAPLAINAESVRRDYDGRDLNLASRTNELNIALVRQQERHLHRGERHELLPQPRLKRFLTLSRNDSFLSESALRRIEIERERAGLSFGPYDGEITDPHLLALINQRFGGEFVHSASSLGIYGNCAYRFLGQRVLKLEPRGEAALDLQAIDAGKLLHDILRRFFERYRRQPLYALDRAKLQAELRELADKVFDEHERVVPPLNKQIWKIDREIRKILLDQVLLYELQMQEEAAALGIVPAYFEVAFGGSRSSAKDPGSKEEPLAITRSTFVGEESIKVSGQIDRVDIANDKTLIAYDYKLSTGSTRDDIKSGRSLQLPIYLEALEKLILPDHPIAGGGYYIIRGGGDRRNRGLYRASQASYTNLQAKNSVFSDDDWRQIRDEVIGKIWGFLDGMRAGKFAVRPAEKEKTCRFCDFKAVCRYERYRIDRKK